TKLDRKVAVKILNQQFAQHESNLNRFIQEAKAASALNHPNILVIYEIGETDDTHFIVSEFIEGKTLRDVLNEKTLKLAEILDIAIQMTNALTAAHTAHIIHRDIKPENIIIRPDGLVKILDFGLAKLIGSQQSLISLEAKTAKQVQTAKGTILGTVNYMSPEQAKGEKVDARTDIFSFGVLLYEMIAGRTPFASGSMSETFANLINAEPQPLSRFSESVPDDLQRIVAKMLCKNKDERYQTMKGLLADLKSLQRRLEFETELKRTSPPMKSSLFKYAYIFAGIATFFLIAGFAAFYFTDFGRTFWKSPQTQTKPIVEPSQQRLISTFPGSHTQPSFSSDGKRIAFINTTNNIPQVWIKDLDAGEPTQITFGEERAERPRWSPVGDEIIYTCRPEGTSDICSVSLKGGEPTKIINGGRNPNWSWDGKSLVFERGYEIWTANKDGSDQRTVEGIPQTDLLLADRMPAFSPDSSQIAFFQNEKSPMGDYWTIPAAGGKAKRLTSDLNFGGAAVWMPDGKHIVFPSQRGGSLTLWRVSVDGGGELAPVLSGAGEDTEPDISRDGRKLIYTNTRKSFILTVTDAKTGESRELRENRLEITNPSFSPDGSRIAFFGFNNSGDLHIFMIDSDGKNLVQITKGKDVKHIMPQWSADGRTIYFYQMQPTLSFRKIPATGGESTEVAAGWEWGPHNNADVSPDETKIIYTKLEKGKPAAALIRDVATGKEKEFTLPLRHPRWSHDGRFIAGTLIPGGNLRLAEITICPVDGKSCRKITNGYSPRWSHDDSHIYFYNSSDFDGESVWIVSSKGGDEKKVTDLRPMTPINDFYNVSPQGEIVWIKFQQSKSELWLADL
ncbi:MAG: protein kinase domain-containing protein, partial [Aridibacter sp.]